MLGHAQAHNPGTIHTIIVAGCQSHWSSVATTPSGWHVWAGCSLTSI